MTNQSTEELFPIVRQAIDLAVKCVSTGETLVPFIMTDGTSGAIITLMASSFDESLAMAQEKVNKFHSETNTFAFAYDGFITLGEKRFDTIYVEAAQVGTDKIHVFGQRYRPKRFLRSVKTIGNSMHLEQGNPKLKQNA